MNSAGWVETAPLVLHVSWEQDEVCLELIGELDLSSAARLSSCIDEIVTTWPSPNSVIADLSELWFADVVGLRALSDGCQRLQNLASSFEVRGIRDPVRRALHAAMLDLSGVTPKAPGAAGDRGSS